MRDRACIKLFEGSYLVPVRFHGYDAFSDVLALGTAPDIARPSSFASCRRVPEVCVVG
jgi:hypothetical protein